MAATPTVPLAVPDLVAAVYLVPVPVDGDGDSEALDEDGEALAGRAAADLTLARPDPAGRLAVELLDAGLLDVEMRDREALDVLPDIALLTRGAGEDRLRQITDARRFVVVTARGRPGTPAVHEWVARGCACVLARDWDVPAIDVAVSRLVTAAVGLQSLPGPDGRIRLADWVVVPHARSARGYWFATSGLARFGLPELQTNDVPPQLVRAWGGALTGIAQRVLQVWSQLMVLGPDGATPAFVELPALVGVDAEDVAAAYATVAGTGGSTDVALRYDTTALDEPSFLTVVPPDDYPASAGEYLASVCAALFGANPSQVVYAKGSAAMARAMQRARRHLPAVRRRFLEGDLPRGAHLMVKYPLERGEDREYVWAYVTSWENPDKLSGAAAVDAALDPRVRVGRPVTLPEADIVDWAVWVDGAGIVEGGVTDQVLGGPRTRRPSTAVVALARGAGQAAAVADTGLRTIARGVARAGRAAHAWRAARAEAGSDKADEHALASAEDDDESGDGIRG